MKIRNILAAATVLAAGLSSCSDWLDVKPSDRISEKVNFSSPAGFRQALNGIYVELNQPQLYGRYLSCEFVEIMAQRYAVAAENKGASEIQQLQLTGTTGQGRLTSVWGTAYNLISNLNLLIENLETNRAVLSDEYYHIIKGEAYALRAYLHMDLFRLFGYPYDEVASSDALPYYDKFVLDVNPTITSHAYMQHVVDDLLVAEEELKDDPVTVYGPKGDPKDSFLSFRNLRLNLYAVRGVLARAYYTMLDDEHAAEYSRKAIEAQKRFFPWVDPYNLNGANIDKVFSSEIFFALQNLSREGLWTQLFNGTALKMNNLLAPRENVVREIFEDTKADGDYRFMACFRKTSEFGGYNYKIFNKYEGTDSLYNQMIPMVRPTESYLILAQTSADEAERLQAFETMRNNRGLQGTDDVEELEYSSSRVTLLQREWMKEFFGEGQLFFWYKRNKASSMRSATDETNGYPFNVTSLSKYVMPIPDAETKYN